MEIVLDNIFRLFYFITTTYVLVCAAATFKLRDFATDMYSPLGTKGNGVTVCARRTIWSESDMCARSGVRCSSERQNPKNKLSTICG